MIKLETNDIYKIHFILKGNGNLQVHKLTASCCVSMEIDKIKIGFSSYHIRFSVSIMLNNSKSIVNVEYQSL